MRTNITGPTSECR